MKTLSSNPTKIALIKIGAIGDVAIACKALIDFLSEYELEAEIHWIIDENLQPVARSILERAEHHEVNVFWHSVHASALFSGGIKQKGAQAIAIARHIKAIGPDFVLLLHRDWRYRALSRIVHPGGELLSVHRRKENEYLAYRDVFDRLQEHLYLKTRSHQPKQHRGHPTTHPSGIGILVGGGRNSKIDFAEKRWPHFGELISKLGHEPVYVFGDKSDLPEWEHIKTHWKLNGVHIHDLVGKTSLPEVVTRLSHLRVFVSVDSGLAHIANAVMHSKEQKIVTLFGPTDSKIWRPHANPKNMGPTVHTISKNLSCSPCYNDDGHFQKCRFRDHEFQKCMREISVDEVLKLLS